LFNYSTIPRDYGRKYAPQNLTFDWDKVEGQFNELQNRQINSSVELEKWVEDESELSSFIADQKYLKYVRYSSQTDNKEYEEDNLHFITEIEPKIKSMSIVLDAKYISSSYRPGFLQGMNNSKYAVMDKKKENNVKLFRAENVSLEKADQELSQKYQKVVGGITVPYQGRELTIYQMRKLYESNNRAIRQEAWELTNKRIQREYEALNKIYDEEIAYRHMIARNAGFENYRDYSFPKRERFDFTLEQNLSFLDSVEKYLVPMSRKLDERRKEQLGVNTLRPWDMDVDPSQRPPLTPFSEVSDLVIGCKKIFEEMDPALAANFSRMASLDLLDLESRRGKATGGYMLEFTNIRLPFIFMNAVGTDSDVRTLLHECGHSFQTFLTRDLDLHFLYRGESIPSEFAEVASTSMELMGGEHLLGTFYDHEGAIRSNRDELEQMVKLFCWVATIDSFQHWVYTHSESTSDERAGQWVRIFSRFKGLENYDGYEDTAQNRWLMQLHLFEMPFYYIDYGLATLCSLGIWAKYRKDKKDALEIYKRALSLGGSRPLPELYESAGMAWDFGPATVKKCADELGKAISEYLN